MSILFRNSKDKFSRNAAPEIMFSLKSAEISHPKPQFNILKFVKLNVVAQKRSGRPRKSWDEVIKNDRKKLDMDSTDPQNRSEWRGRLRGRLVKKPNPR